MPAVITYPGVLRVESVSYTASLGITPGVATLVAAPEESAPAAGGDLTFGDADGVTITLADCYLERVTGGLSEAGNRLSVVLLDRRWRWALGPGAAGHYNQTDRRGKLRPKSVRSPYQLAVILLRLMGEAEPPGGWAIALPAGLAHAYDPANGIPVPGPADVVVNAFQEYLDLGQNTPPTGTNPTEVFGYDPAAVCLARLCERYGAAVCFDPVTDVVCIVALGTGDGLPDGPCHTTQVGLHAAEAPSRIDVIGAETRYQLRVRFRAVNRDHDDGWVTLDELTYAPGNPGDSFRWAQEEPGAFGNVQATDRLSWWQARALAVEGVYRCYQLVGVSPADPAVKTIPVPGYRVGTGEQFAPGPAGYVDDRFLIVLQDTRPEQIAPRPPDVARIDPVTNLPFAAEVYNGYSNDRAPVCFAAISQAVQDGTVWANANAVDAFGNTPANSKFYSTFEIVDPERQVIRFPQMVWRLGRTDGGTTPPPVAYLPADLVVETGVIVLDPVTHEPERPVVSAVVPGGAGPPRAVVVEQVQREVIGEYAAGHSVTGWHENDNYWKAAGRFYADAIAATYQISGAQTNVYIGVVPVSLGGRVRQVSWSLSRGGYLTTASLNTEHSKTIVPYPKRRRAENLPPDPQQAFLNRLGPGAAGLVAAANAVGRFVARALSGGR